MEKKYREEEYNFILRMRNHAAGEHLDEVTGEDIERLLYLVDSFRQYYDAYYK